MINISVDNYIQQKTFYFYMYVCTTNANVKSKEKKNETAFKKHTT